MGQSTHNFPVENLSSRELQILSLISEGLTNREIARKLILTTETIKWYNKQIYGKLNVSSRTQAVHQARQFGLLHKEKSAVRRRVENPNNLPQMLTSFVGRQAEVPRIKDLLQSSRLVTLTGAGGSGKTRLALEVAQNLAGSFKDGVWLMELASVSDPSEVVELIARVLRLNPRDEERTKDLIIGYLENRHTLLVLDNFEHLMDAAPLVGELLAAAPRLSILATSRERLNLYGEYEYLVQPMGLPDLETEKDLKKVRSAEAVELFVQRAQATRADFTLEESQVRTIARICKRLDGLPLAIELAAARTRMFNPGQLLERLENRFDFLTSGARDLPDRQRTLRQAIDWSYELLDGAEKRLFASLGSFQGGFSVAAVEAIFDHADPVETLASLLSKSLLYQYQDEAGETRLWMLETIYEYARSKLAESGIHDELRDRQLDYYLDLVESYERGYRYHAHEKNLNRTMAELPNLRAVFDWALATGQHDKAARIISSTEYFFRYLHLMAEGYQWVKRVLAVSESLPEEVKARFFCAAASLASYNGDVVIGNSLARESFILAEKAGDEMQAAWSMIEIVCSSNFKDERDENLALMKRALDYFRARGEISGIAHGLNLLGEIYRLEKDFQKAEKVYSDALDVALETGEVIRESFLYANLAIIAYHRGEAEKARELACKGIQRRLDIGHYFYACTGLAYLAGPVTLLGDPEKAARLLGASDAINVVYGTVYQHTDVPEVLEIKTQVRNKLGDAAYEKAYNEGRQMTSYEAIAYGLDPDA